MKSIMERMKDNYELRFVNYLPRRIPVIIRLDGRAFHTFTRKCKKPFDEILNNLMVETTKELCRNIQGCKLGYTQSDEISLLVTDFDTLNTDAWFDYNINKIVSISASIATAYFNNFGRNFILGKANYVCFDSRAFSIPKEEVTNYFIARQQDWIRNSVQMLAQSLFPVKQLQNKKNPELIQMCLEKGYDWNTLNLKWRYGTIVERIEENNYGWMSNSFDLIFNKESSFEKIDQLLTPVKE